MSNLRFSSIHSPKYLILLFTDIGLPSHKILGCCVAVLAPRVITNALDIRGINSELITFHPKIGCFLCLIKFSNSELKRYKNQVNDLNAFGY